MEDIETKVDVLLDMYKEDRAQQQSTTSAVEARELNDASQRRALRATTDDRQSSELCSPCRTSNPCRTSSDPRQHRAKPMLRNLSDLGPGSKKRVTYSASGGGGGIITLDFRRPSDVPAVPQHQPSIVNEEDEDVGVGQQPVASVAVDDIKSSTSDTSSADVASQSDLHCLRRYSVSVDAVSQYLAPSPQTQFDNKLPTYKLASCDTSIN